MADRPPAREREVIVTEGGPRDGGPGGVIVAIVAIVAIIVLVVVLFNMFGGGSPDATVPDNGGTDIIEPEVNIDIDSGGTDDGTDGGTDGDADTGTDG